MTHINFFEALPFTREDKLAFARAYCMEDYQEIIRVLSLYIMF